MRERENRPIGERLDELDKIIEIAKGGLDMPQDRLDMIIEEAEKKRDLLLVVEHTIDGVREGRKIKEEMG